MAGQASATSPVPPHMFMPQTTSVLIAAPTYSPIPKISEKDEKESSKLKDAPINTPQSAEFKLPKLRLEIRDLNHPGSQVFLSSVVASEAFATSVKNVLSWLYESPGSLTTTIPPTRSVTLILRSMGGVAYTTGSELDNDHKEIHFSLEYIKSIPESRKHHEIMGVLTHEMVHCYQYDAFGTSPGGLTEGIADWVRLNCDLSPPHWKKDASGSWDAGYQHTGYFLEYLETRFGKGTIRRLNEKLRISKYDEKKFWTELCGRPVEQLWGDYAEVVGKGEGEGGDSAKTKEGSVAEEKVKEEKANEEKAAGGNVEEEEGVLVEKEDVGI